jgi:hypothetical protein
MENNLITQQKLHDLFIYDCDTGVFIRRIATGRNGRHRVGTIAGSIQNTGYIVIYVNGARYVAHRLAWLYMFGEWPLNDLDHINGVKKDNCIKNLRLATRRENMQNVAKHKHNTSGLKGVSWHEPRKKWRAYIFNNYKQIHLGLFDSKDAAFQARKNAEIIYHSHRTF